VRTPAPHLGNQRNSTRVSTVSSNVKELILASAIETAVIEPTARHLRQAPALRIHLPQHREPLDLSAEVFRYAISTSGEVRPAVRAAHIRRASARAWSRSR
jgi:hypothetical protein